MAKGTTARRHADAPAGLLPRLAKVVKASATRHATVLSLRLENGSPLGHRPGQFVQVSVFGYGEIPISICSAPSRRTGFDLCVQPRGNVSRALASSAAGEYVGIRGPYGQGNFPVERMLEHDVLLVGGGIGMAPLRALLHYIVDSRASFRRVVLVYGARTPEHILFAEDLRRWQEEDGIEILVTVDQGDAHWRGRTGVVTEPLKEIDQHWPAAIAVACGPPVMFRFIALQLLGMQLTQENIYFSLERHFKCGMGKCGHCQLDDLSICRDGPVLSYADLLRRPEAVEVRVEDPEDGCR